MKRRLLGLVAMGLVCTPIGGLVSSAFGKAGRHAAPAAFDAPCWFSPERLLLLGAVVMVLALVHYREREKRNL